MPNLDSAPAAASVAPAARPYSGGPADGPGVLVCHGFSGNPRSMRPWAEHLASAGFAARLPRLPGHGTSWRELNVTGWPDWYACVERALLRLVQDTGAPVFATGLSMGGALALRLAQRHPELLAGLVLVNPVIAVADPRLKVLRVIRYATPSLAGIAGDIARPGADEGGYLRTPLHALYSQSRLWALIRADLGLITTPLLVYRSRHDHVADDSTLRLLQEQTVGPDRTFCILERSYHVATLDYDASAIFEASVDFFTRLRADR